MSEWISDRKKAEMDNADRVRYFDKFIDMVLNGSLSFDDGISAYKETLEHQGIPLSPKTSAQAAKPLELQE